MIDRFPFKISGLPRRDHQSLLTYLQNNPDFTELKTQLFTDSPDGGQTDRKGAISGSVSISYYHHIYRYKDYLVTINSILGQVYITCEKVTQELLFNKYEELKQISEELAKKEKELDIKLKTCLINERIVIYRELKDKFRDNKRQIKQKLTELKIIIKPGSELSKLLRLDCP